RLLETLEMDERVRIGGDRLFTDLRFDRQGATLQRWAENLDRLQEIITYRDLARPLDDLGLDPLARIADTWGSSGRHLADLFERAWLRALLERAMRERPALAGFDGAVH